MDRSAQLNINLLQPKNRVRVTKIWGSILLLLALLAILAALSLLIQSRELSRYQDENMRLKTAIQNSENEMTVFQPMQALEQEITIRSEEVEALEKTRLSYAEVMNELDRVKPPPIIIVVAEIKKPKVIINGFSPDHTNVIRMLEGIKSCAVFSNVALISSEFNEKTNEVKFTLEIEWEAE